jgi:predicted protein tyrosine phosphatase
MFWLPNLPIDTLTNNIFLCARNRLRSPTAAQVFTSWPGVETASDPFSRRGRRIK